MTRDEVSLLVEKCSQDPGLPRANPTRSRWQDPPHPTLSTKQSTTLPKTIDVLIIGSGITGASLAYHLLTSNPDISVLVAEARTITSGATGRNGGQILALPYEGYKESVTATGLEATKALIDFRGGHLNEILNITKTVLDDKAAKESEIRVVETVDAVFDQDQWIQTKEEVRQYLKDFPENEGTWKLWEGEDAEKNFGIKGSYGVVTGRAGAIWPYRFVTSVYKHLVEKYPDRIHIETNTPVLDIQTEGSESDRPYISETHRGSIRSKHIIHATNGHAAHLLPRMCGKIVPLRGQMSVQRRDGASNLGNKRSWLFKSRREFNYMTQNPASGDYFLGGGTLQSGNRGLEPLGSTKDDQIDEPALAYLRTILDKHLDRGHGANSSQNGDASEPSLVSSWTGIMGFSSDDRPWVGKLPFTISGRQPRCTEENACGEWIAAGFCGMGMVNCWRSGRAVASMMFGEDVDWFPKSLLPTEERFETASIEAMATHWVSLAE